MKYIGMILLSVLFVSCHAQNKNKANKTMNTTISQNAQTATLAGGCFWCIEAVYLEVEGVESVVSGYTGGQKVNPTYEQVCAGTTGHAEAVEIKFNPDKISYKELLEIFFVIHDPTTLNRQGNDIGTQYRSAIYYHSPEQKTIAEQVMKEAQKQWEDPIVTELTPAPVFYKAEDYHQNYYNLHPNQGYCAVVINPKLAKFRKTYKNKLKKHE
jgi:peptide-methionine (S)-S-oxide reductase